MTGFNELRAHNRITWLEQEHGWIAAPEDIVNVLSNEGFEECKRVATTSRRDRQPAGGLWQGVNTRTGPSRAMAPPRAERDPYQDEGGEG